MKVHDDDQQEIDATFQVERIEDGSLTVLFHSRSGVSGGGNERNRKYTLGLRLVLERLGRLSAKLTDAAVDSLKTRRDALPLDARRILPADCPDGVQLDEVRDFEALRLALGRRQGMVGRADGGQAVGMQTKRIRLYVELPRSAPQTVSGLEQFLANGAVPQRFFALLANSGVYDVQAASHALADDHWMLPQGETSPGDRVVFWRTLGRDGRRGVVAFGEVVDRPRVQPESAASLPFWGSTPPTEPVRRVQIRYVHPPKLPLWLDEDKTGLLASLSVSRGQGTKLYAVSPEHWAQLVELAGGWPPAGSQPGFLPIDPAEIPEGEYPEGLATRITVNHYERNPAARRECIAIYGVKCTVCGFDFEAIYGPEAKGYIHVHHIVPVSTISKSYKVNPRNDLRPVCPNCHAMLHATNPPIAVDELRRRMGR